MELAHIFRALWGRKLLLGLVVMISIAAGAAIKLRSHTVTTGLASAQIIIDAPQSALADLRAETTGLASRAPVFAQLMASQEILRRVARIAGIPVAAITAEGPFTGPGAVQNIPTPSEARSAQVTAELKVYRLTFVPEAMTPVVTVSAGGPSPREAARLADAVYPAVVGYLASLQGQPAAAASGRRLPALPIPARVRVTLRQLGPAQVGAASTGSVTTTAAIAFLGILILGCLAILGLEAIRPRAEGRAARRKGSPSSSAPTAKVAAASPPDQGSSAETPSGEPMPPQPVAAADGPAPAQAANGEAKPAPAGDERSRALNGESMPAQPAPAGDERSPELAPNGEPMPASTQGERSRARKKRERSVADERASSEAPSRKPVPARRVAAPDARASAQAPDEKPVPVPPTPHS